MKIYAKPSLTKARVTLQSVTANGSSSGLIIGPPPPKE